MPTLTEDVHTMGSPFNGYPRDNYVYMRNGIAYEITSCNVSGGQGGGGWGGTCELDPVCIKPEVCEVMNQCTIYEPESDADDFCTFDEWEVVEQGTHNYSQKLIEQSSRMFPADPNPATIYGADDNGNGGHRVATWKINAKGYSCDPLKKNDYCVDVLNEETQEFESQCYNYEEFKALEGSCSALEENPRCEKTGDSCAEGWYDSVTEICYMFTDDYRCDESEPFEVTQTKTTNVCAGMLPCMGNDCAYGEEESSDDFEKAVLMGSIAQTVDDDSKCASEDPSTCEIFPGEEEYCSWELSGLGNNCCEEAEGINYLEMAATGYKMMQTEAFQNVSSTLAAKIPESVKTKVGGLYRDFTTMLVDGWNTGATAVVDFTSSIMGDPEFMSGVADALQIGGGEAAKGAVSSMMYKMTQQLYSFVNGALPEELAKELFVELTAEQASDVTGAAAGDLALTGAAKTIASIVTFIGIIYTIYNVVKILANLLTQCDENEQDMGVKLAQKQCFKNGNKYCHKDVLGVCVIRRQNWCCYSSMLSRIIADQGSKQIGKDMRSCPGFTVEEFGRIDFDRLDLSEWLSTMYEADILSTSGYDIERLTGSGRSLGNLDCDGNDAANCQEMSRKNANVRASEQFSGDASGNANVLKETIEPEDIDCSVYPRPMICELNN